MEEDRAVGNSGRVLQPTNVPNRVSGRITNARLEFIGPEASCQSGRQSQALISASASHCTRFPSVPIGPHRFLVQTLTLPHRLSLSLYNIFLQQNGQAISYTSWYCRMLYGEIMLQSIYLFLGGLVLCSNLFQIGDAWIRTLHSLILSSIANHDYIQSNAYSL